MSTPLFARLGVLLALLLACSLHANVPEWIWHPNDGAKAGNNETRYFRKTFTLEKKPAQSILSINADDEAEVWINGSKVADVKGWNAPTNKDIANHLKKGENVIAVLGKTGSGEAGILVRLRLGRAADAKAVVSDATWLAAKGVEKGWEQSGYKSTIAWIAAKSLGKAGVAPWGDVMKEVSATAAKDLTVLPGFKVELLHSATGAEGSWIGMTVDSKGRFIISPQSNDQPLFRVTVSKNGKIEKWETIAAPIRQTMGLLYAFDSLYANGTGPQGNGLYRLVDKNKNDQFEADELTLMKKFAGEGEHGHHGLALGPDNKIYVMNGNHTKVPEGIESYSAHKNYDEDFLLPRQWDAGGHAVGILAPGGYVVRTDAEGSKWELVLGGFRNAYDLDFNADGELFTFDSDMEWEWGMHWYKPTRILHSVSGAEFGWRSGSAKWPAYYPDSLPATVDIGIGSPTGVKFGTKATGYPEKYKRAFYAMDWSYGRIVAVHLTPNGASYTGSFENFVKGKPLNVTDLDFGKDGAMYFITGGRGTQAGLYRVSYVGSKSSEKPSREMAAAIQQGKKAREVRHALEAFHGSKNPEAVAVAWPYLNSKDRFIRYAARIAVESQEVASWRDRALNESSVDGGLTALLALARVGGKETQADLLSALKKFPLSSLSEEQKLAKLRVIQLSFIRQGKPAPELAKLAIEKLNAQYPAQSDAMNRELCQLLVYLEAPDVIEKTFELIKNAKTQEEQMGYIFALRNVKSGWTMEQRRDWFSLLKQDFTKLENNSQLVQWFGDVGRDYTDGASFNKHLANIKKDAVALLSQTEKEELADVLEESTQPVAQKKPARVRTFVKDWVMPDLEPKLDLVSKGRNFEKGKAAFEDAQCLACHRFGNDGGSVGPELTAAGSKYSRRDILDAILEPSKVVSEQYQNETIYTKDGEDVTGRVVDENDERVVVANNPFALDARVTIKKSDIEKRGPAKLSPMPTGLLNNLSQEDILDMLAYIESMGKARAANFKK